VSSTLKDPRERTLTWIEEKFEWANVTDDNGNAVTYLECYDEADYPFPVLFIDKYRDVVLAVGNPTVEVLRNADKTIDSFRETIPITCYVADKHDLTATKIKWLVERELRRIANAYIFASVRLIKSGKIETQFMGAETLHSWTWLLEYVREIT